MTTTRPEGTGSAPTDALLKLGTFLLNISSSSQLTSRTPFPGRG